MSLEYKHLCGLPFNQEKQHCYTILRSFYRDNYNIELPDIACPTDWWERGFNLYAELAAVNGFDIIHDHPRDWKPGDVIVCAINSPVGNHLCIVLDNGKILHHLVGQLSRETSYGGIFRNTTVGVYRHRSVAHIPPEKHLVDIKDLLPLHVRRRLEILERDAARDVDPVGS